MRERQWHELNYECLKQFIQKHPHETAAEDLKRFQTEMASKLDVETDRFSQKHAKNDKIENHEDRLQKLEKHTGLAVA